MDTNDFRGRWARRPGTGRGLPRPVSPGRGPGGHGCAARHGQNLSPFYRWNLGSRRDLTEGRFPPRRGSSPGWGALPASSGSLCFSDLMPAAYEGRRTQTDPDMEAFRSPEEGAQPRNSIPLNCPQVRNLDDPRTLWLMKSGGPLLWCRRPSSPEPTTHGVPGGADACLDVCLGGGSSAVAGLTVLCGGGLRWVMTPQEIRSSPNPEHL